jgi:hypothetical protein
MSTSDILLGAAGNAGGSMYDINSWDISSLDIKLNSMYGNSLPQFNGTNSWMQTNSVNFTGTNKMTVWAGVRKLSDTAGIIFETSANFNSNPGSFIFYTDNKLNFGARKDASGLAVSSSVYSGAFSFVGSALVDFSQTTASLGFPFLRVNAVNDIASYSQTFFPGAGNFRNYPLFIGVRAGAGLFFNGRFYGGIIRGAQSTTQQISDTETWVNDRTGAYA